MKLLVCISRVPDTTTKISFTDNNTRFDEQNVQFVINPYDEWFALVRALEIKEKSGGSVTVIHVGNASGDTIIRKALAIGADDAIRINCDPSDAFGVASQIGAFASDKQFDMILVGKETIDYNGSSIGGMLAEMLDLPFVSYASKLDIEGSTATLHREIEGGKEIVEVQIPAVISAQKGMAEARIPSMRGIMAARTKPLQVVDPVETTPRTAITSFELPPAKGSCKYVDAENAGELINLLRNEAKVI